MAMSLSSGGSNDPIVDMNTTPLIDVMLVLLIMFIITLPAMNHSINLDMPQGPAPDTKREAIELAIEYDGTILWNGAVVSGLEQLERHFKAEAARQVQPELHVRPDKRAKYDHVAQVLGMAQRSGIERIGFAGQEQYSD